MDTTEDRAQPTPPWVYASRMQETPVPTAPSALPRPLSPRVQLPNSQFSGSHLSQLSGPLFTEDRYSTSSGSDQESCDAEVDHIMHNKKNLKPAPYLSYQVDLHQTLWITLLRVILTKQHHKMNTFLKNSTEPIIISFLRASPTFAISHLQKKIF